MTRFAFTFLSPYVLAALLPVAMVALWTLLRPGREMLVVSSLRLWQQAVQSPEARQRIPSRQISLTWLLLLCGAAAAVLAASRPAFLTQKPTRRIAVALYPSAELASRDGMKQLREAFSSLMGRLEKQDRVQLLLPDILGGEGGWMSPADAERYVDGLPALPVRAKDMALPEASPDARKVFAFVPAGSDVTCRPGEEAIELPCPLSGDYIENAAGNEYPDSRAEILINVAHTSGMVTGGKLTVTSFRNASSRGSKDEFNDDAVVYKLRSAEAMAFEINSDSVSRAVYLVRRPVKKISVALRGDDMPMIRRFINAATNIEIAADESQADVLVINGEMPQTMKSSIIFNPPSPPAGWKAGEARKLLRLEKAKVAVDEVVMKDVNLAAVAVRRMTGWVTDERPSQKRLASIDGAAFILREEFDSGGRTVRRIYVAFDPAESNTNFGMTEAFVVFMANCLQWLAPAEDDHNAPTSSDVQAVYEYLTPLEAAYCKGWERIYPRQTDFNDKVVSPGIYRDTDGRLHAVSLLAVHGGSARLSPEKLISESQLPTGEMLEGVHEFWPIMIVLAAALWLGGWVARVK